MLCSARLLSLWHCRSLALHDLSLSVSLFHLVGAASLLLALGPGTVFGPDVIPTSSYMCNSHTLFIRLHTFLSYSPSLSISLRFWVGGGGGTIIAFALSIHWLLTNEGCSTLRNPIFSSKSIAVKFPGVSFRSPPSSPAIRTYQHKQPRPALAPYMCVC